MKPSILYRFNTAIQVLFFGLSIIVMNYFTETQNWFWVIILSPIIILIEYFILNAANNPLIKRAKKIEAKSEELLNNGITNHYFMRDGSSKNLRNEAIINAIDSANELFLLAETGKSYLDIPTDRHWKNIKKKLDNGINFKILLINPFSENKKFRNSLNNITGNIDRKLDFGSLISLSKKYHNVEIKFTNEIYCSLFFTDTYMIYDPYHLGKITDRIENNFIAIEFSSGNENYNILKNHFQNCWKGAIDLNEMKSQYEQNNINI